MLVVVVVVVVVVLYIFVFLFSLLFSLLSLGVLSKRKQIKRREKKNGFQ